MAAERTTFHRSSTLLATLLTFCPPGPPERENASDSSPAGIVRCGDTNRSRIRDRSRRAGLLAALRRRLLRLFVHAQLGLGGGLNRLEIERGQRDVIAAQRLAVALPIDRVDDRDRVAALLQQEVRRDADRPT